jgi:hypothetical protein
MMTDKTLAAGDATCGAYKQRIQPAAGALDQVGNVAADHRTSNVTSTPEMRTTTWQLQQQ